MKHGMRTLESLVVYSLLLLSPVSAQQAPREEPNCKSGEVLKQHRCVPILQGKDHGTVAQSGGEENPPVATPPPEQPRIPRCKQGETVGRDGRCIPGVPAAQ